MDAKYFDKLFVYFCFVVKSRQGRDSSCPFVESVWGLDSLESPEVGLVQVHALGVPFAESLSHIGIMNSLSVSELDCTEGKSEHGTEEEATLNAETILIQVVSASLASIISIG